MSRQIDQKDVSYPIDLGAPSMLQYHLRGRIASPTLFDYTQARPNEKSRQHWREKILPEVFTPEPDDFTSMRLLSYGALQHGNTQFDWGSFEKPGKPFSGDVVYLRQYPGVTIGLVVDSATMLRKGDEVPREVQDLSMVDVSGAQAFLPDHALAAFLGRHVFEDKKMPIHPEIARRLSDIIARPGKKIHTLHGYFSGRGMNTIPPRIKPTGDKARLPYLMIALCHQNVSRFYSRLLSPEFTKDKKNRGGVPSAVMVAFASYAGGEFEYAYTGDVDVLGAGENGIAYKRTTESVSVHDEILDDMGRENRGVVFDAAWQRIDDNPDLPGTGNITGIGDIVTIRTGSLQLDEEDVVIRTDGNRLPWHDSNLRNARGIPEYFPGDVGATLLLREPLLYQMDAIRVGRTLRRKKADPHYGKNFRNVKWRADDSSFMRIRKNPVTPSFFLHLK